MSTPTTETPETLRALADECDRQPAKALAAGDFVTAKESTQLAAKLESAGKAETHTPGPLSVLPKGDGIRQFQIVTHDGCFVAAVNAVARGEPIPTNEPRARLLAAAYTSYDRHYGPGAVKAAETDQLGDALAALEKIAAVKLDDHDDAFEAFGMRGDIARTALVNFARATGGKS